MRTPRFQGLTGRLSYANVMATLAFFFALTGGSMAATKYLTANDPIAQGDLAGSTYGSPVIAAGKVTTGKIADGAVTNAKLAASARSTTFATTLPSLSSHVPLMTLDNGLTISGTCGSTVVLDIQSSTAGHLQLAGTSTSGTDVLTGTIRPADSDNQSIREVEASSLNYVDFNVIGRDSAVGSFARIDVHGGPLGANGCPFWGMITPSG